jgi:hypothetical protein
MRKVPYFTTTTWLGGASPPEVTSLDPLLASLRPAVSQDGLMPLVHGLELPGHGGTLEVRK